MVELRPETHNLQHHFGSSRAARLQSVLTSSIGLYASCLIMAGIQLCRYIRVSDAILILARMQLTERHPSLEMTPSTRA